MGQLIKSRLVFLNKTGADVIRALNERNIITNPSDFSKAIGGTLHTPKARLICSETEKILNEWENKNGG
jgi:hypothetical protein